MKYFEDNLIKFWCMDFRKNELPNECVQMVCTSPPYWGLRKYSGEQDLIWGDNHCEHEWRTREWLMHNGRGDAQKSGKYSTQKSIPDMPHYDNTCSLCGAWKGAYGLEPTPEMYVSHTVEILREIRRVLRKDGVCFWNIGDSYAGSRGNRGDAIKTDMAWKRNGTTPQGKRPTSKVDGMKPKDLCLIPFRVAIAAQEDGWWVRSVIIWSKPNPMPESVTDRPTESHEYILLLTKSKNYYWDADAVRTGYLQSSIDRADNSQVTTSNPDRPVGFKRSLGTGANLKTVWEFPTQPYPAAHFAVFPEKLPELCIKAATPEVGCCSKCGAPWERITESHIEYSQKVHHGTKYGGEGQFQNQAANRHRDGHIPGVKVSDTLGWQPTCKCNADKVPSIVLDPFMGAGTTLWVAKILGRRAYGFDTSKEYCELALDRNRQGVFSESL